MRSLARREFWLGVAALFICAAQAPAADQWHLVARNSTAAAYIDPATLERDGDSRTIRTRLVPTAEQAGVADVLILYRFECARRTFATLHVTLLRADGSQMTDTEITGEELTPQPAPADTNIGAMLDAVCGL